MSEANFLLGKEEPKDTAHPYPNSQLHPETQHMPLHPSQSHLRPPPPSFVSSSSSSPSSASAQILVSAVAYRDGERCATTLSTAFARARHPKRIRAAVVDQTLPDDTSCRAAYCRMAQRQFTGGNSTDDDDDNNNPDRPCPHLHQITFDERDATQSKGPVIARHHLQRLVQPADEFCLGIDGHSVFTNDWDVALLDDWTAADNEMGILTTYVHHSSEYVIRTNGDNNPHSDSPHLCDIKVGGHGLPRNEGATNVRNATVPILQSKWGAGFAFGKCHSERRVPIDEHASYIFDGEEFSRAALLWMAGYDFYSPTPAGHAVYHNYTSNPITTTWGKEDRKGRQREEEIGANRIKLHLGQPFRGAVDTKDIERYSIPNERARSLDQFLNYTGVSFVSGQGAGRWDHRCHQLHWVPYLHPEIVEAVVPGWKQEATRGDDIETPCESSIGRVYQEAYESLGAFSNETSIKQMNGGLLLTNFVLLFALLSFFVERARRKGR